MALSVSDQKFIIEGGKPLYGTVKISGSKNAALPILCAALLTKKPSIIHNVPHIADIYTLLEIFHHLHVKTTFKNNTVTLDPSNLSTQNIPEHLTCSMRASILLLGPLLAQLGVVKIPFPGGCVLGKRTIAPHTRALKALGAEVVNESEFLHLKVKKLQANFIRMAELSVTATENTVMLAVVTPGITNIALAALEPHVQDLCHFLNTMGAKIKGIGTHFLQIEGVSLLEGAEYRITGDYLEAGTYAIASLVTKGEVILEDIQTSQLDSFWEKLDEIGASYELKENSVLMKKPEKLKSIHFLHTAVYPSFATDLQAPFAVLLTQAEGQSEIFETLFEGRLNYLFELEKMGAKVEILNPHQAVVNGPKLLKGVPISSCDIRAGAAMVLAALCAEGITEISNINYIDRGYENLEWKLENLGAKIQRI